MKKYLALLIVGVFMAGFGCEKPPPDPRERPGFIDTSDPTKVPATMTATPKKGKNTTGLKGMPKGPTTPGGK